MKSFLRYLFIPTALLLMLQGNILDEMSISCQDGNADACLDAGKIYSAKMPTEKHIKTQNTHIKKIAYFYKRSCELGSAEGCRYYAMHYMTDLLKDPKKGSEYYFQKACNMGDFTSCTLLKMMPDKKRQN